MRVGVYILNVLSLRGHEGQVAGIIANHYRHKALRSGCEIEALHELGAGLLLALVLGIEGDEIIAPDACSKPRAEGKPCFSISHSNAVVALAVARSDVGIDVEHVGNVDYRAGLRVFPKFEREMVEAAAPSEKASTFLACWTSLEARLKARGSGFLDDPRLNPEILTGWHCETFDFGEYALSCASAGEMEIELVGVRVESERGELRLCRVSTNEPFEAGFISSVPDE